MQRAEPYVRTNLGGLPAAEPENRDGRSEVWPRSQTRGNDQHAGDRDDGVPRRAVQRQPDIPLIQKLIFAGLLMSTMGPAGSASFTWGSYAGPEGNRRYKLFVPAAPAGERKLIVMLHGCTQDPEDFARGTRMNEV